MHKRMYIWFLLFAGLSSAMHIRRSFPENKNKHAQPQLTSAVGLRQPRRKAQGGALCVPN
jgi:hypothetical protein